MNHNGPPTINPTNPIVELAKKILADAEAGAIGSLGVIAVDSRGMMSTSTIGPRLGDLYVGAAILQANALKVMMAQPAQGRLLTPIGMK